MKHISSNWVHSQKADAKKQAEKALELAKKQELLKQSKCK